MRSTYWAIPCGGGSSSCSPRARRRRAPSSSWSDASSESRSPRCPNTCGFCARADSLLYEHRVHDASTRWSPPRFARWTPGSSDSEASGISDWMRSPPRSPAESANAGKSAPDDHRRPQGVESDETTAHLHLLHRSADCRRLEWVRVEGDEPHDLLGGGL